MGRYWNNIPGYEDRSQSPACEQTGDMDHILFVCPLNQGKTLWCAAKHTVERKGIAWPQEMDHTYVTAAPLLKIKNRAGKDRIGAPRLCTIVILECAWQTWETRCNKVIDSDQHEPIYISSSEALNSLFKIGTQ